MREDQRIRLNELQEKLTERFLNEADPDTWPGGDKFAMDMSREERGDSYWCKKNAAATMMLMSGVDKLTANTKEALGRDPHEGDDLDKQISRAEALASKRADAMINQAKKATFDQKTRSKG